MIQKIISFESSRRRRRRRRRHREGAPHKVWLQPRARETQLTLFLSLSLFRSLSFAKIHSNGSSSIEKEETNRSGAGVSSHLYISFASRRDICALFSPIMYPFADCLLLMLFFSFLLVACVQCRGSFKSARDERRLTSLITFTLIFLFYLPIIKHRGLFIIASANIKGYLTY